MTRNDIFRELVNLLRRHKHRFYLQPRLIWERERLEIVEGTWFADLKPVICKLKRTQIKLGFTEQEWSDLVDTIQEFLKGIECKESP